MEYKDLASFDKNELQELILQLGEKKFRAAQVYEWIHKKNVDSYDEMSNISAKLKGELEKKYYVNSIKILEKYESKLDGTCKYLMKLHDGNIIESVLMRYNHGNSVCISSQVGCRMGCKFCASTLDGLVRGLEPAEMVGQIYKIQKDCGERISNVVVMGSGEPLDNYDVLIKFIKILTDENGLNISQRNITVSTCGIVPMMRRLADEKLSITLAVSLHSPTDEMRRQIMPIANKYSINEILDACRYYFDVTGRRISFEYSLIKDNNDTKECAIKLCELLKGMNCHVNLIPINPVKERNFKRSERTYVLNFKNMLEKNSINVTIRREMGADINAACGQLRKSYMQEHDA